MTSENQEYYYCREALYHLNAGNPITPELAYSATREALAITNSTTRHYFLAAIFHGMLIARPSAEQIVSMLEASFSFDDYHPTTRPQLTEGDNRLPTITIMGSGKKGLKTVNISTLAAITASSSKQLIIIKPCAGAISSLTGSADFLDVLNITAHKDTNAMKKIALKTGLGLFFVSTYMPVFMQQYDGVFYAPHAMSYAFAGLVSPYSTDSLLYGVALADTELSLDVLKRYNIQNPTAVSSTLNGIHFVDEALLLGKTTISSSTFKKSKTKTYKFGNILPDSTVSIESFSPVASASKKDNVLKGLRAILPGSQSDLSKTIALNAGVIMHAAGVIDSIEAGYVLACNLIQNGDAWRQLIEFTEASDGDLALLNTLSI